MPQMHKLSNYKTTIETRAGKTRIVYHSTCIVEFDEKQIILRTGGWDTVTTRRKMNQASRQFDLGFTVYRADGQSLVTLNSKTWVLLNASDRILKR